jgi:hypothetical protein
MAGKVQVARRERLSRICKHIIDGGPRSVDDDIRAQLKAATLKYAATQYVETEQALKNLYRGEGELGSLVRKAVEIAGEADRDDGGDETDVTKGEHRGHHSLTSALIQHLHDALDRRREAHGYHKSAKEQPAMSSIESLENIAKTHGVAGVVEIAKNITDAEKSYRITEEEFVKLIDTAARVAHPELGALAFEKVYERNPVLAKAIAVIKASLAESMLSGGLPVYVVSDGDVRNVDNPRAALDPPQLRVPVRGVSGQDAYDTVIDPEAALAELNALGRKLYPELPADIAFSRVFEDPKFSDLAARAHRRPTLPVYALPR